MPDIFTTYASSILINLGLMLTAYLLALPSAFERERRSRSAGIRTFPLVAIGACGFLLVGESFLEETDNNARLMQGLMGGLGFLGGGAILKGKDGVAGMATAASIWVTGAIGMAVAYYRFEIAVVLSAANYLSLVLGSKLKDTVCDDDTPKEEEDVKASKDDA